LRAPPPPPLVPYTTLFRSVLASAEPTPAGGRLQGKRLGICGFGLDALDTGRHILPNQHRIKGGQQRVKKGSGVFPVEQLLAQPADRKSTRLNSSHVKISYA